MDTEQLKHLKEEHKEIYDIFTGFSQASCHYNNPPSVPPHP